MDKIEILKILSVIDVAYPRFNATKDKMRTKKLLSLWYKMFIDSDYYLVGVALKAHIATSPFPPAVADIKQIIDKMANPQITEFEAWAMISRAVQRSDLLKQYSELPEEIKGFMSYRDFKQLAHTDTPEGVVASNWQRSFRTYQERQKFNRIAGIKSANGKQFLQDGVQPMLQAPQTPRFIDLE